jgi:predicted dehydrogenase
MNSILIIGAGQLGSRHLQALGKSQKPYIITVVDPSSAALQTTKHQWENITPLPLSTVIFVSELPNGKSYDLVIIATTSIYRANITKQLLTDNAVQYIIFEKFLFPRLHEYAEIRDLLDTKGVNAWVNCPRRMWPSYREIFPYFQGPIRLSYGGGAWGLGCNSIHLIDLAAYFSGTTQFEWNIDYLDPNPLQAKRSGYVEFSGMLVGTGNDGTSIVLYARAESSSPTFLELIGECAVARLDETHRQGILYRQEKQWQQEPIIVETPFQSELTNLLADDLFTNGVCFLTTYNDSSEMHTDLLKAFLVYWIRLGNSDDLCPIT